MNPEIVKRFDVFRTKTGKYADLELDKVKFEIKTVDDIETLFKKGRTPKYSDKPTDVIVIKSGQARGYYNNFDFSQTYYLETKSIDLEDERILRKGDILINTTGKGTAGRVTLFDSDGNYVVDSHIAIFRFDHNKFYPEFLFNYFVSIGFDQLEGMATGSGGQIELGMKTLKSLRIPIPKALNEQYSSVALQQVIIEFIEFHTQRYEHILNGLNRVGAMWDKVESLVLPLTFAKETSAARRFNIFCQRNGYELTLEEVEFEDIDIFNHKDVNLQGPKKLANHNKLKILNDPDGLPIYDASSSILTYVKKDKYPNCVFQAASDDNPDLSFANEGNSSAGTNFLLHTGEYFVNNHRTVVDFSKSKFLSKYVYHSIKDMKERYGFRRGYIPSQSELSRLKIAVPIPKGSKSYNSWQIQNIISDYFDSYLNWIKKIKLLISNINHLIPHYNQTLITTTFNAMKRQAQ